MTALNQGRSRLGPYREQRATRGERRGSRESEQSLSSRDRFTGQRVVLLALPRRQRRVAKNRCAPERVSPESRAGEPHAGPRREARHGVAQRRTSDFRVHETDSFRSATSPRRSRPDSPRRRVASATSLHTPRPGDAARAGERSRSGGRLHGAAARAVQPAAHQPRQPASVRPTQRPRTRST